jgi:hypothetical protein
MMMMIIIIIATYTHKNHTLSAYVACSYELASVLNVKQEINLLCIILRYCTVYRRMVSWGVNCEFERFWKQVALA